MDSPAVEDSSAHGRRRAHILTVFRENGYGMIVSTRSAGGIAIVDLHGRLTLSPALNQLKTRIEALLTSQPVTGLVLNFAEVSGLDSAGLGELMRIHTFAKQRGLRLALAGINPKISEVLKTTRLDGLFAVCADEASALQHVAQA